MSYFVAGILRIVLLEASVALLVIERLIAPVASAARRRFERATYVVATLAIVAFCNFGQLHGDNGLVHPWEQYHFFIGSKYLSEVGYFDLYKATVLADREGTHRLDDVRSTRDLHDFEVIPLEKALVAGDAVKARFSPAQWAAFADDWAHLSSWPAPWPDVISDHGNSGSPAWALVALPFVELFGSSHTGQVALALVDILLMVVMFAVLRRAFGGAVAALGIVIWCTAPFCYDYLGGSILRWDWLFALGLALACFARERYAASGALLGYAIASKLFPICFAVALVFRLGLDAWRKRSIGRALPRLVAGMAASVVAFVIASSIAFGGLSIWKQYQERIGVAQVEKYYPNQYSLKTVYLQLTESSAHSLSRNLLKPAEIKQARADVDISDHAVGFLLVRLALTALALAALAKLEPIDAFVAGPFLIFIWLTVNAYYWNMLGLSAIVLAARQLRTRRLSATLIGLCAMWSGYYFYQHLSWPTGECYFVSLVMIVCFALWALQALLTRKEAPREAT